MFNSILIDDATTGLSITDALLCTLASIVLGVVIAFAYTRRQSYTKGFVITLTLMPVLVQAIIMMVNGNLGTGVAVMGAFSLVRFRSAPGGAREIVSIMFAMAVGLATGMGYLTFAAAITVVIGLLLWLMSSLRLENLRTPEMDLRITVPEDLEFDGAFDDLFGKYTHRHALERVKTTNMGSLYELTYRVTLKDSRTQKALLDDIRCRNGNLAVSCCRAQTVREEL